VPEFEFAVALLQAPGDDTQWYVAEQSGLVHRFDNVTSPSGASVFIDISSSVNSSFGESGLLGVAFHPDYAKNHFVYLSYTATGPNESIPLTSRLSRFLSNDGGLTLDPSSEVILLRLDQPDDFHNGGHIVFGPDGYLYMGFGDGGGDPLVGGLRSQNTLNLFGSVLRLDVDGGVPYAIPADNPFAGNPLCNVSVGGGDAAADCPEIFAWGFRNPWRFSFDRATGKLCWALVRIRKRKSILSNWRQLWLNMQEGTACFNPATGCDTRIGATCDYL
jgi:glucose/arabinose dehydrogenase